jgi:hypothetical protein
VGEHKSHFSRNISLAEEEQQEVEEDSRFSERTSSLIKNIQSHNIVYYVTS